jgi:hypothetical protein
VEATDALECAISGNASVFHRSVRLGLQKQFFVEKCELQWNEESGKQVGLRRAVNDNTILLVRLVQGDDADRSQPVAYEAEGMGRTKTGMYQFRLNRVAPRRRDQ